MESISFPQQNTANDNNANASQKKNTLKKTTNANPPCTNDQKNKAVTTQKMSDKNKVKLSKLLSCVLRHRAIKLGLHMKSNGFVSFQDLLNLQQFKNYTEENLIYVVKTCQKQRFALRKDSSGSFEIRANQGHTIRAVKSEHALKRIQSKKEISERILHGTYYKAWNLILKSGGLCRMKRNHIHMAANLPGKSGVISGMRSNAQVYIWIDAHRMLEDGIVLYRSANNVLLCEGDVNGFISIEYFSVVTDAQNRILFDPMTTEGQSVIQGLKTKKIKALKSS